MKYIKLFEGFIVENELNKICDNHLAYLLDDGFNFNIDYVFSTNKEKKIYTITFGKGKRSYRYKEKFNISEIKDDFILLLEILDTKYYLEEIIVNNKSIDIKQFEQLKDLTIKSIFVKLSEK